MSDAAESSGGRGVRGGAFAAITRFVLAEFVMIRPLCLSIEEYNRGVRGGAFAAITIYISNYTTNQCIRKALPATTLLICILML